MEHEEGEEEDEGVESVRFCPMRQLVVTPTCYLRALLTPTIAAIVSH